MVENTPQENEKAPLPYGYGFRPNFHTTASKQIVQMSLLEKYTRYYVTSFSKIMFLIVYVVILVILVLLYVGHNAMKAGYTLPAILCFSGGALLMMLQISLIDPAYGTVYSLAKTMSKTWKEQRRLRKGLEKAYKRTGILSIDSDGVIHFVNGDYGLMYIVDGKVSRTAFPAEIDALRRLSVQSELVRVRSTTHIDITSTEPQNPQRQIANLVEKYAKEQNPVVRSMLKKQRRFVNNTITNKKQTIIQYKILRDSAYEKLIESKGLFEADVASGLYYAVYLQSRRQIDDFLVEFEGLR